MSEESNTPTDGQNNTNPSEGGEANPTPNPQTSTLLTDPPIGEAVPKEGEGEGKKEEELKDVVPEKYEDFNLPEGMKISSEMMDSFSATAKELNLTQEKAQKMIDVAVNHTRALEKQSMDYQMKARQHWVKSLREDKEFGGANFDGTIEKAKRSLDKFGTTELKDFLVRTGMGDNNEIIKFFAKVGQAFGEDKVVDGENSPAPKSAADIIYGNNN